MKRLFCYQKSRGGIIDIEAEENKLLLITEANSDETPSTDTGEVGISNFYKMCSTAYLFSNAISKQIRKIIISEMKKKKK